MDLAFADKGGCSSFNYLQADLLMAEHAMPP